MANPDAIAERYLAKYGNTIRALSAITTVALCILAVGNIISFYRSNVWKPTVTVTDFDFEKAVATIQIGSTQAKLYGNSTLSAGGTWGVRFGTTGLGTSGGYDTIELTKNDMVYDILQYKNQS